MGFNRAEPTCYRTNFPYASSSLQNAAVSYIILCLTYTRALILELGQDFPIVSGWEVLTKSSLTGTKPVFVFAYQERLKPACSATETSYNIDFFAFSLFKERERP